MADLATLSIRVDTLEMKQAQREMDSMSSKAGRLENSLRGLASALGVGLLVRQFFEVNAEFQRLGASLQTVTGSSQEAARAFAMLQDFAKSTPYELTEVTQAFINLKTRGLDASRASMTAIGDYASSFGRSMADMVQAISGVVMGETEAIKSFGVTAQAMGDKVALSFRGQTTIVKRNAMEIQAYFNTLSNANFAGGMERQIATLGGAWSNLKDQIASTFFAMGNAGASQKAIDAILGITNALAEATPTLAAFTSSTITAISDIIALVSRYKTLIGLSVVVLGVMVTAQTLATSSMVKAGVAAVALAIRTGVLAFAVSGYSVSAAAAAAATAIWTAAMKFLSSVLGIVTVAIGALYVAYQYASREAERLNKEVADNKIWHDRAKVHKDFGDSVTDLAAKVALMRKAMAGDKGAKAELDDPAIAAYRKAAKELNSEGFDRQIQERIRLRAEEKRLQEQIDARNKAQKDAAEEEQRKEGARKSMIRDLKEQVAALGLTATETLRVKAAMIGLGNSKEVERLISQIEAYTQAMERNRKVQARDRFKSIRDKEFADELERQAQAYRDLAVGAVYPYLEAQKQVAATEIGLEDLMDKKLITMEQYEAAVGRVRSQLPILTDTFGDLRQTFDDWARSSTDALVDLAFTGKAAFTDLVNSMLRDLARLMLYKNVTKPLFDWIPTLWDKNPSPSGGGGGVSTTGDSINPINGVRTPGPSSMQSVVNVTVHTDGTMQTSASGGTASAVEMSRQIEGAVRGVLIKEQRPGGILAASGAR